MKSEPWFKRRRNVQQMLQSVVRSLAPKARRKFFRQEANPARAVTVGPSRVHAVSRQLSPL
ncbi:MAG: hypothetical protein ACK6BG_13040 [Cyanobacteriota bacterium]